MPELFGKDRPCKFIHSVDIFVRCDGFECTNDLTNGRGDPCGRPDCMGRHKACPYRFGIVDNYDTVQMVGHHLKYIRLDIRESFLKRFPLEIDHFPGVIENHFPVANFPKE